MGRTESSKGLAPPAIRKDTRAKQARQIINKVIPALLASNARARKGAESSELIANPSPVTFNQTGEKKSKDEQPGAEDAAYVKRKGQGRRKAKLEDAEDESSRRNGKRRSRIDTLGKDMASLNLTPSPSQPSTSPRIVRVVTTDTLSAAQLLSLPCSPDKPSRRRTANHVFLLNMASPLRPGGGVLNGATSQEEFLCARTTLLPSLQESFYRLPEYGGIYTKDVLVFRSPLALGEKKGELVPSERYYVDVVSAGMLRFPELEGEEEAEKRLGKRDREVVEGKMRAVLRIAVAKGARKIVLGAWGCGAYRNPVVDIASAWRRVLGGGSAAPGARRGKASAEMEVWSELEEVVFAIQNRGMAEEFAKAYGGIKVEADIGAGPGSSTEGDDNEEDEVAEELRAKICEMEAQLSKVWNLDLKERLGVVLEGLKVQLKSREGGLATESDEKDGEDSQDDKDSEDEDGVENGEDSEGVEGTESEESEESDVDL